MGTGVRKGHVSGRALFVHLCIPYVFRPMCNLIAGVILTQNGAKVNRFWHQIPANFADFLELVGPDLL